MMSEDAEDSEEQNPRAIRHTVIVPGSTGLYGVAVLVLLLVGASFGCISEKDVDMEVTGQGDKLAQENEVETWCEITNHGAAGSATIAAFVVFEGTYGEERVEDTETVSIERKGALTKYFYFDMPDGTSNYTIGFDIVTQTKD